MLNHELHSVRAAGAIITVDVTNDPAVYGRSCREMLRYMDERAAKCAVIYAVCAAHVARAQRPDLA